MKIVDRKTFLALPPNTLFSKYEPAVFGPLCIKLETWEDSGDFFVQCLAESIEGEIATRVERGESIRVSYDSCWRDGLFEEGQRFAVWEPDDIQALIARLQECLSEGGVKSKPQ